MKVKHNLLLLLALSSLSSGQMIAVVQDIDQLADANVYRNSNLNMINQDLVPQSEEELYIVPTVKTGNSQKLNAVSTEDSLIAGVESAITNSPERACEIVKEAITISDAQESLICRVLEAAILAAPDQLRLISQCAIASAPDSLNAIHTVLASYESAGDASASGKEVSGKEVSGKEVSGKEVSGKEVAKAPEKPKLADLDILRIPGVIGAATSARNGLNPRTFPWPQSISPNSATNTDVSP